MSKEEFFKQSNAAVQRMMEMNMRSSVPQERHKMPPAPSFVRVNGANKRNDRIDKWIQALAIPFVLALITGVLEYNSDMIEAVSTIFSIVVIFAYIISGIWIVWNIKKLFTKHRMEQLKYFSEDLQGALDCVKYFSNYKKPKR